MRLIYVYLQSPQSQMYDLVAGDSGNPASSSSFCPNTVVKPHMVFGTGNPYDKK